ncbi:MAG TPA: ComEC/Rec2 family competence protein, partial [Gemmatimonadales bacterium]|nr:ComEC/Rec2 family competence protein [Gemmatimonadales bacterium]
MRSETRHPPLILLLVAYGAGLATGLARFPDPRLVVPALLTAAVLLHGRPLPGLLAGGAFLGAVAGRIAWWAERDGCAALLRRGAVTLTVVPLDPPPVEQGRVEAAVEGCGGEITVRWGPVTRMVSVGVPVRVRGKWYPRPDGLFGRPGGTLVVASATPDLGLRTSNHLRARLLATTRRLYGDRAPLVDALLFDRKGAIDRATRDRFAASGLVHLLSISGFHVGLIVGWVLVILRAFRMRRERAWVGATLVGVAYVAWLGWPAPATRAAALAVLMCVANVRQRVVRWDVLLAATAFVVLIVDPWALADLGAWLSVASLWGATVAVRWSDRRIGTGMAVRTASGSIGATVATAPLTAGAVGSVAIAGVALNFIGIPVAAVAVPAVLGSVLLAPLWRWGAEALAAGGGGLLALLDQIAAVGAAIPFGHFTVETGVR